MTTGGLSRRALVAVAMLAALGGCAAPGASSADIVVDELDGPFDPLTIQLTGLSPGADVVLLAEADIDATEYRSRAAFVADESGAVDLDRQAPADGDWTVASSMAPFWSLAPSLGDQARFDAYAEPYDVELTLTRPDGTELASTIVSRGSGLDRVVVEEVAGDGMVAAYTRPAASGSSGPRSAVLVFGGSEGGLDTARMLARWLATAGYPALAISYFGSQGQPTELAEVPLEPFLTAAEWLRAQPEVDPERVTAFGVSRGGEVALWLAAEHPELMRGAIAPVGAGEFWCGYPDWQRSAWTLGGEPMPCTDLSRVSDASVIDLAGVDGPLVLACGEADEVWDSCGLMTRTVARAEAAGLDFTEIAGDGASHFIPLDPYLPAMPGTDPAADATARAEFWHATFEALGRPDAR